MARRRNPIPFAPSLLPDLAAALRRAVPALTTEGAMDAAVRLEDAVVVWHGGALAHRYARERGEVPPFLLIFSSIAENCAIGLTFPSLSPEGVAIARVGSSFLIAVPARSPMIQSALLASAPAVLERTLGDYAARGGILRGEMASGASCFLVPTIDDQSSWGVAFRDDRTWQCALTLAGEGSLGVALSSFIRIAQLSSIAAVGVFPDYVFDSSRAIRPCVNQRALVHRRPTGY